MYSTGIPDTHSVRSTILDYVSAFVRLLMKSYPCQYMHIHVVIRVLFIYLFKIDDRTTRGPLILSQLHKNIQTRAVYEKVQKTKKQTEHAKKSSIQSKHRHTNN